MDCPAGTKISIQLVTITITMTHEHDIWQDMAQNMIFCEILWNTQVQYYKWQDMTNEMTWHLTLQRCNVTCDRVWHDIIYDITHSQVQYDIWHDMTWHNIWHYTCAIWHMTEYDEWYDITYDITQVQYDIWQDMMNDITSHMTLHRCSMTYDINI